MADTENKKGLDIFGIEPIGAALKITVEKTFHGVEGFLKSVCLPALDEVGLMFKDQVRYWRLNNVLRILEKAKGKLHFDNEQLQIQAHPRVALAIIENGSLNDNDEVQELWAGLFASSCTESGQDDQNLIFVDLLKQLTVAEAKILKFSCEKTRKIIHENGLVVGDQVEVNCNELVALTGVVDVHRLDRELDHLRSLDLIGLGLGTGGFTAGQDLIADVSPTALALNLYIRTQGFTQSTADFWKTELITTKQIEEEEAAKGKIEHERQMQESFEKMNAFRQEQEEAKATKK